MRDRPAPASPRRAPPAGLVLALAILAGAPGCRRQAPQGDAVAPSTWVDPLIGTACCGNVVPAAMVPFGMTQMGPLTVPRNPGGYEYSAGVIAGFPLTALSGAGCPGFNDFPIQPFVGALAASPELDLPAIWSSFSKRSERATPGGYAVRLDGPQVDVEIAAARRANLARFTFPPSRQATLLIRAGSGPGGQTGASWNLDPSAASFAVVGSDRIEGTSTGPGFCFTSTSYTIHFAVQFDRPFAAFGTWAGATLSPGARGADGPTSGAYAVFDTTQDRVVRARVAISFVDRAGAWRNLAASAPDFDLDAMRRQARAEWDERLGQVRIDGGSDAERRVFYTALYHALAAPNVFSDADGRYLGFDAAVHATGRVHYQNFSGWDVYRSWFALLAIVAPDVAGDLAQSLVLDGQQCGAMPKWAYANQESGIMNGDPAPAAIATAHAFGARNFDAQAGLALSLRSALQPGLRCRGLVIRPGLANYLSRGYVPVGDPDDPLISCAGGYNCPGQGAPSTTLEYASADFATAMLARSLGDEADAQLLLGHAQSWQNLFNPASGFVQPRGLAGAFLTPFDPASPADFVEGNAWQYTWMVPHAVAGLSAALGGDQATASRLDAYFQQLDAGMAQPYASLRNEPSFGGPWLYDWVGRPAGTQRVVRRALEELFSDAPAGLPGNDDLGALSAWAVWAALGLYPSVPGVGGLALGSPRFPGATIALQGGQALRIVAPGAGAGATFVRSLRIDGVPGDSSWLPWEALAGGGTLELELGAEPSGWGGTERPPSWREGQAPGIGYLASDAVTLDAGGAAARVELGVQNLTERPLQVTVTPVATDGVSVVPDVGLLSVPPSGRASTVLSVVALASGGDAVVPLVLRTLDGVALPPVALATLRPRAP